MLGYVTYPRISCFQQSRGTSNMQLTPATDSQQNPITNRKADILSGGGLHGLILRFTFSFLNITNNSIPSANSPSKEDREPRFATPVLWQSEDYHHMVE